MNNILKNFLGLSIISFSSCQISQVALAGSSPFGETTLNQAKVVAIASPYGDNQYNLLVVEQLNEKKQCWAEKGQDLAISRSSISCLAFEVIKS